MSDYEVAIEYRGVKTLNITAINEERAIEKGLADEETQLKLKLYRIQVKEKETE